MNRLWRILFLAVMLIAGLTVYSFLYTTEIARVTYRMSSCFGGTKQQIRIYKENNNVLASLMSESGVLKKVTLTAAQVKSFDQFYRQLAALKEETGCTTVEVYTVYYKGTIIKKADGGCHWMGYDQLVNALFKATP